MDLSVIVPCYNEAEHLTVSVAEMLRILRGTRYEFEVIFVDDGSRDNTRKLITDICETNSECRYIFHESNKGRGGAFKTGYADSKGKIAGFIDIDLEVHALYIPYLVSRFDQDDYDVVTGYRYYLLSQTGGYLRHILSIGYRLLVRAIMKMPVKDPESGCKFFNRATASEVVLGSKNDGWFWDTEVMCRSYDANLKVLEYPVLFLRNYDKTSTVRLVPDTWDYMVNLWKFKRSRKKTKK
jgi:glycosyltransferase involved in cell wall biosynthesis